MVDKYMAENYKSSTQGVEWDGQIYRLRFGSFKFHKEIFGESMKNFMPPFKE